MLAIALEISLLLEQVERGFDVFTQLRQRLLKVLQHENADVTNGGLEFLDVFDEKQGLQQTNRKLIVEQLLCIGDGTCDARLQRLSDAFKH